jgi:hypothetical protein
MTRERERACTAPALTMAAKISGERRRSRARLGPAAVAPGGVVPAGVSASGRTWMVVHVIHAAHLLGDRLDDALLIPLVHRPLQRDLAILHADRDVARVDVAALREPLADVLADALVYG